VAHCLYGNKNPEFILYLLSFEDQEIYWKGQLEIGPKFLTEDFINYVEDVRKSGRVN